jgi:hypothetical protein
MAKALTIVGMLVAALLLLIFALDLALGIPFGGSNASSTMDIGMIVCGAVLFFLSWSTYREQV